MGIDMYDIRILKCEDWYNFKMLFEKVYFGYVLCLWVVFFELIEVEE